jgi:uncharacterized protein (DUF433 family)
VARRKLTRLAGDVREHPRYSVEEAAAYLRIPVSTLSAWTRGQNYTTKSGRQVSFVPRIELADSKRGLLSFYNLAEAHILRCTRDKKVPLKNVRLAVDYVRREIDPGMSHVLLSREFKKFGKYIFIDHLGQAINATRQGQLAFRKLLGRYLERIKTDADGNLIELYPIKTRHLAINPLLSSGKPIVKGTGINAMILRDRLHSGESEHDVASDYGLSIREVKQAVQELAAA